MNIFAFILVKMIFGLGGRAISLILLIVGGAWLYYNCETETFLWIVFGSIAAWLILRAILYSLPTGIYPTFKDK